MGASQTRASPLELQPNDHINVIASFLTARDLLRCLRVSRTIARQMARHIARSLTLANQKIRDNPFKLPELYENIVSELDLRQVSRSALPNYLGWIFARCGKMLRKFACWHSHVPAAALAWCPNLVHVDLAQCCVQDRHVEVIAACCPGLLHLNISDADVTDKSMLKLAEGCPELSQLHVYHCVRITTQSIVAIARNGKLTVLNINDIYALHGCKCIQAVAWYCSGLRELYMTYHHRSGRNDRGDFSTYELIASNFPALERLDVSHSKIASHELLSIVHCHTLTHLYAKHCRIDEDTIDAINSHHPKLVVVDMSNRWS
jgi:hypothetical protein